MICLRCGYCCFAFDVVILLDPEKGLEDEDNYHNKPHGETCPHNSINAEGLSTCAIHDHPIYEETPCFRHSQIESNSDKACRMGKYIEEQRALLHANDNIFRKAKERTRPWKSERA